MRTTEHQSPRTTRRAAAAAVALTVTAITALTAVTAAGAVAAAPAPAGTADGPPQVGGRPGSADVHLEALVGIPPRGYGMQCTTQADCHETGTIDLATVADVEVALDPATRTTHGTGDLSYTEAEGGVGMSWACEGEPGRFASQLHPTGTTDGELEVVDVMTNPRDNSLTVLLDPAGDSGSEFPREDTERSDGGCGADTQVTTQEQGLWYYHFHLAHQADWQDGGNVKLTGLTWKDGVYSRTFNRFVTVGFPPFTYPLFESTTIEVVPEYCAGGQNRIRSASTGGTSLGLDGMRFFPGQRFTFPEETRIDLGDGSTIKLDKGGSFTIDSCDTNATRVLVNGTMKSFWMHFSRVLAGSDKKFDVQTERAVAGVRGDDLQALLRQDREAHQGRSHREQGQPQAPRVRGWGHDQDGSGRRAEGQLTRADPPALTSPPTGGSWAHDGGWDRASRGLSPPRER